jgi:uncharacterized protein YgbK (DUF1537 family)
VTALLDPTLDRLTEHLRAGRSVILHSSLGANDPRTRTLNELFTKLKVDREQFRSLTAQSIGEALGRVGRSVLEQVKIRRVLVAGGDTSSYAGRALGIEAIEMITPLCPGAPLCRAFAPNSSADGIEINFKGGQVGFDNYFLFAQEGMSIFPRNA